MGSTGDGLPCKAITESSGETSPQAAFVGIRIALALQGINDLALGACGKCLRQLAEILQ